MKYNWAEMNGKQKVDFANIEYGQYKLNKAVTDKDGNIFGYVADIINDPKTGLQAYVITPDSPNAANFDPDQVQHVTVMYRGSTGVNHLAGTDDLGHDARQDWFQNDVPIAGKVKAPITNMSERVHNQLANSLGGNADQATPQLKAGGRALSREMGIYRNAQFDVYGHSLGAAVGAYALGAISEEKGQRIRQAFLYEGPNVYGLMNDAQRARVAKLKQSIFNYIDSKDPVALGYEDPAVGTVIEVDSKKTGDVTKQHMWGGYQYDQNGNIKASASDMLAVQLERLNILYETYQASGTLTASQQILLDVAAAMSLVKSVETTAIEALNNMIKMWRKAIVEAQTLWQEAQLTASLVGPHLSHQEMHDALARGGVTKALVVDGPTDYYEGQIQQAQFLKTEFKTFVNNIRSGINQQIANDQTLAKGFKAWD